MSLLFKNLFKYQDLGLLIFRIIVGSAIAMHGWYKFEGGENTLTAIGSAVSMFGVTDGFYQLGVLAAASELIGGILVVMGLFSRLGSLFVIGTLTVAVIMQYPNGFAKWIYPVEMMAGFVMIFVGGPGKYSIDYMIAGNRR